MLSSLPIVQRELLVASRKRLTFWSRILAAVSAFLAVFLIVGIEPDFIRAGALGAQLFRTLTWPAFGICLLGSVLLTADCLSVEKREGTLGLLFLTDLKGYDVVLGKFVAKSITAVFELLAIIPMLAIPILLGGVTAGDFWRVVLVLLNTTFLSLSIGIWASVQCRDTRNVFAVAVFLIFLLVLVPMLATAALPARWRFIPNLFNPVFLFTSATPGLFRATSNFYASILVQHLLGWLCLGMSSVRVQTSWQERVKTRSLQVRWREALRGSASARLALRRKLLPKNPILWLGSRDWLLRVMLTLLVLGFATIAWFLNNARLAGGFHWSDPHYAIITMVLLHFTVTLLITFDAGSRLVAARREGALTMVLSSRLSVEEILRGEFLAVRRLFIGPLLIVLFFDAVWLFCVLRHCSGISQLLSALFSGFLLPAVLLANCWAVVWAALYNGLRAKHSHNAALKAFVTVVGTPLMLFGLTSVSGAYRESFIGAVLAFSILNLITARIFGKGAYGRLKNELRQSLIEPEPPPPKDYDENFALLK